MDVKASPLLDTPIATAASSTTGAPQFQLREEMATTMWEDYVLYKRKINPNWKPVPVKGLPRDASLAADEADDEEFLDEIAALADEVDMAREMAGIITHT